MTIWYKLPPRTVLVLIAHTQDLRPTIAQRSNFLCTKSLTVARSTLPSTPYALQ